jgi:hypothetical protein
MADVQQRSWFARNWIWVVPVGCLLPIVGCVVAVVGCGIWGMSMIQESPALKSTMAVSTNPDVMNALGGNVSVSRQPPQDMVMVGSGVTNVDFTYDIRGASGTATVHVVADRQGDKWNYTTHTVTIEGTGQVINVPVPEGLIPDMSNMQNMPQTPETPRNEL